VRATLTALAESSVNVVVDIGLSYVVELHGVFPCKEHVFASMV
jgi:hypothetical protein